MSGRHRHPIELPLVPLVDVFSMILIFLIMGGVMGGADLVLPKDFTSPRSGSPEVSETLPTIIVSNSVLKADFVSQEIPYVEFRQGGPKKDQFIAAMRAWIDKLPEATKKKGVGLNVAADRGLNYGALFELLAEFRMAGFETLMIVAQADRRGS